MKLMYIPIMFLLCSCGVNLTNVSIPLAIAPYSAAFEQRHVIHGIQWKFDSLPNPVIGRCTLASHLIELDVTYWASATDTQREETVTHELGHCILGRGHDNAVNAQGTPVSLMNAYLLRQDIYFYNKVNYLNELFTLTNVPMLGIVENTVWDN